MATYAWLIGGVEGMFTCILNDDRETRADYIYSKEKRKYQN